MSTTLRFIRTTIRIMDVLRFILDYFPTIYFRLFSNVTETVLAMDTTGNQTIRIGSAEQEIDH